MRSVVVLPQPDGPRSVANAPFGTSNDTSSTAVTPPKRFVTCDTRRCGSFTTSTSSVRLGRASERTMTPGPGGIGRVPKKGGGAARLRSFPRFPSTTGGTHEKTAMGARVGGRGAPDRRMPAGDARRKNGQKPPKLTDPPGPGNQDAAPKAGAPLDRQKTGI